MSKTDLANPAALGLAGFGLTTVLLNIHNVGLVDVPLATFCFGFFYGGLAQVIAGVIEGRRGEIFGFTAFTSYGLFWIALSLAVVLDWLGVARLGYIELGFVMLMWGLFTAYLTPGAFTISRVAIPFVFITLTLLFFLLSAAFFTLAMGGSDIILRIAGVEGIICGLSAMYSSAAILLNTQLKRNVLTL